MLALDRHPKAPAALLARSGKRADQASRRPDPVFAFG